MALGLAIAALAAIVAAGCAGAAPASPPAPLATPGSTAPASPASSAPTPRPSAAPTVAPSLAPSPASSATAADPDRYPSWLVGRLYATRATEDGPAMLRRVGLPGEVELAPGSFVVGSFGDRVMTTMPSNASAIIRILSFETGAEVASATVGGAGYGVAFAEGIVTNGLEVISAVDGSVRTLHDPGPVPTFDLPTRVVAVSENGRRVATSICQSGFEDAFNCRATSIIEIATGELLDTVDAGDLPVHRFTNRWLFTRSFTTVGMVDAEGQALWTNDDLSSATLWYLEILGGDVVAIAQGIDGIRETLVRVEALTGDHEILFTEPDGEDWRFWTGWSSDEFVVLGHADDGINGVVGLNCDPCGGAITAGTINLATGAFDPDAIHINLTP
jgi:hypothetical protein